MSEYKKNLTNVDPVDHENKIIENAEDYVTDKVGQKQRSDVSDTMKDPNKQVSAEIDRDEVDERLNKGC